jgi:hypothetical protein
MAKYLEKSKKEAIHREGVTREYIELLLWVMEQTDSPDPIMRLRWWEYRSKMEHPPEIEGSSIYTVPFVRVPWQSEPVESSSTKPNCKRRKNSWHDDASPPSSPSPFTSSHGAAVCHRGIGGDSPHK